MRQADYEIRVEIVLMFAPYQAHGIGLAVGIAMPPFHKIGIVQRQSERAFFAIQLRRTVVACKLQFLIIQQQIPVGQPFRGCIVEKTSLGVLWR